MPDPNKLQVLRDAGFRVVPTCRTCYHFETGTCSDWGTCKRLSYDHAKHTEGGRRPSVPPNGWCPHHMTSMVQLGWLGAHHEFFNAGGAGG